MRSLFVIVVLLAAACVDLAGANAAFCERRPEVCGAEDAGTGGGGGEPDAAVGEDAGIDAGHDAGSEADAGAADAGLSDAGVDAGPSVLACDAPGLVAFWRFDEDAGTTLADCSPNALHAQVVGTPWRVAGVHGSAFSFNGQNLAEVGNALPLRLAGAMTLSAWVKLSSLTGSGRLISKSGEPTRGYGWELWVDSSQSRLAFTVAQSATSSFTVGASVPTGQWAHVAGTFTPGGEIALYVDGTLARALTGPVTGFDTDAGVRLGNRPDGCCAFSGLVDDLRVFDRALDAGEIATLSTP